LGRNKIQDIWRPELHRVTARRDPRLHVYTIQPVAGGPERVVNRRDLQPVGQDFCGVPNVLDVPTPAASDSDSDSEAEDMPVVWGWLSSAPQPPVRGAVHPTPATTAPRRSIRLSNKNKV
jgi:hypothetical protein